ncbi:tyrosinase family oxidase copper chaperone [Streptomyces sp. NPDC048566]|uniref:tyrosinase family oxidase copper chaperone n=1 Tax=Streptomyces sp. NPDC048566 TaxID=3365569 RepID=UPI00371037D6
MFVSWVSARSRGRRPRRAPAGRVPGRGAERGAGAWAVTRRGVTRGLLGSAVVVALAPVVAASRSSRPAPSEDLSFDEVYRGRHLLGRRTGSDGRVAFTGDAWLVTVDGRPLHLMRRADGGYLSMLDHYAAYPTALEAARAAVDELGAAEHLMPMAAMQGGSGEEGSHGTDGSHGAAGTHGAHGGPAAQGTPGSYRTDSVRGTRGAAGTGRGSGGGAVLVGGTKGGGHHHGVHA